MSFLRLVDKGLGHLQPQWEWLSLSNDDWIKRRETEFLKAIHVDLHSLSGGGAAR